MYALTMINHEDIANIARAIDPTQVTLPRTIADIYRPTTIMVQLKGEQGGYRPVFESEEIPGLLCIVDANGQRQSFTEPTEIDLCTIAGIKR